MAIVWTPTQRFRSSVRFGLVAGITSFLICWQMSGLNHLSYVRHKVLIQLNYWRDAAIEFEKDHQRIPASLEELLHGEPSDEKSKHCWTSTLDHWVQPIQYRPHSVGPEFVSLGRDGKPGGIGVDADITSGGPLPRGGPTLWQFTFYFGRKFVLVSFGIGLIGRVLYLREIQKQEQHDSTSVPITRIMFLLVITSLLTCCACAVMTIPKV